MPFRLVMSLCALPALALAAVIELDPAQGQTLEQTIGRLRSGDTAVLLSGYHGVVQVRGGHNQEMVTVTAKPGHIPTLGGLSVGDASRWTFRGLVISPSLIPGEKPKRGTIVSLASRGGGVSSELVLEDCFVYSELDMTAWSIEDWNAKPWNGVSVDNAGTKITVRNCFILNTNFALGLNAPFALAEGNIIENFAGDGIRCTVDDVTAQYNVIKNNFKVNNNHDDGIQTFLYNRGTGTVRRQSMLFNVIINREDENQKFPGALQGIGFFDGPLIDYRIEGNVIAVSAHHGIALYDAVNATIVDNTVFDPWGGRAWIMLGTKPKVGNRKDNTVKNNVAHSFRIESDGLKEENNKPSSKELYDAAFTKLRLEIDKRYGATHPLSGLPRVGKGGNAVKAQGYAPYVPGAERQPAPARTKVAAQASPPVPLAQPPTQPTAEALQRFDAALRQRVTEAAAQERPPRFRCASMNGAEIEVRGLAGDNLTLFMVAQASQAVLPLWPRLTLADRAALAQAVLRSSTPGDHLLAAFYARAIGELATAQRLLAQAGPGAAETIAQSFAANP